MDRTVYLFEAKGVQRYILAGGRLLDIAGGSELLVSAIQSGGNDLLASVLDATEFEPQFSRRGGGAFMLHCPVKERKALDRFRALWRLSFSLHAPGLEFAEVIAKGEDDIAARARAYRPLGPVKGESRLIYVSAARDNSAAALLPVAGPFVARAPRTGAAAVEPGHGKGPTLDEELVDETTLARRAAARASGSAGRWPAADRFLPEETRGTHEETRDNVVWPTSMDTEDTHSQAYEFPFGGREPRRIGLVHIDVSNLGEIFTALSTTLADSDAQATEACLRLSRAIETAIETAAREATEPLVEQAKPEPNDNMKVMPARPVLLGGDDLTVIVRGDLALDFASNFLTVFEKQSKKCLAELAMDLEIPELDRTLTACAGVVFANAKQPFHMLLGLSEDLCSYAKRAVKDDLKAGDTPASAIAFHRVTTSFIEQDYDAILDREKTTTGGLRLAAQPYRVGEIKTAAHVAEFDKLRDLASAIGSAKFGRGPLREVRTLVHSASGDAERVYKRWREVAERSDPDKLKEFDEALTGLLAETSETLPFGAKSAGRLADASPLFDALDLEVI